MISLLLKDILLQKKSLLFALGYSVFVLLAFQSPGFASASYIMGTVASSYMLVLGACAYEEKTKSDIIINSLPVSRRLIVCSKYLSTVMFVLISLIIIGVLGTLMKAAGLPLPRYYPGWKDVLGTMVSAGLLMSVYLPVYFKFGYIRSRFFTVVFMVFLFAPAVIMENLAAAGRGEGFLKMMSYGLQQPFLAGCALLALVLAACLLSLRLSLSFYQRREF